MEKLYIIKSENDDIRRVKKISKEALQLFEDGYIEIFDITDPNNPLEKDVFNDTWKKL